jgi:elongation factor 3
MPIVAVQKAEKPAQNIEPPPKCADRTQALQFLADKLLDAKEAPTALFVRALGEESNTVREPALAAGIYLARTHASATDLLAALEGVYDHFQANPLPDAGRAERTSAGLLTILGELGERLDSACLARLLGRLVPILRHDSPTVGAGASRGIAALLRGARKSGLVTLDGELKSLLGTSLQSVSQASSPAECHGGALGVGAVLGGAGAAALSHLLVVPSLMAIVTGSDGTTKKPAQHAREAAVLSIEQLSLQLGSAFEPYGLPLLRPLVALYADKDKRVADAAARGVQAMLGQLSSLSVKQVLPALYDGCEAVAWRTKVECLQALSLLAQRHPSSVGPRLPAAIPRVMECLANTNAKVMEAASSALPHLLACVENPETLKLKGLIIEAFRKPETTLVCIDELLCTTFVNAMDGTSLAFIMPLLLRGLGDSKYELVKKAAVCAGNVVALVKNPSEVAPFVPTFEPLLAKCTDHSSPDVRAAADTAKARMAEVTAVGEADVEGRKQAVSSTMRESLSTAAPELPAELVHYLGDAASELLEQNLGAEVQRARFDAAPAELASLLTPILAPYPSAPSEAALASSCGAAISTFSERLSDAAKAILNTDDGADYAVDVQNAILAFAGRVLLRGCDLRFQRGRRYGLIGQNGVGKTTLLNRLGAKDIMGFPQELRTWYIRHEVVCDDGISTLMFVMQQAPPDYGATDDKVTAMLTDAGFPAGLIATDVNQLSGGWKMKLSIAISILHQPELLLLDEPTNHLDRNAIHWLTAHLLSLTGVTVAVVSHDYDFIESVCTDIAHYDNGGKPGKPCKLVYYPMSFKEFQRLNPDLVAGLPAVGKAMAAPAGGEDDSSDAESDVSSSGGGGASSMLDGVEAMMESGAILPIRFPDPGKPEGIRTYRKPIMTMKGVHFRYPGTEKWVLTDANVTVTLGSRAVLLGANGAGKTTFLKLLVGDLELVEEADGTIHGEAWRHHNLRVSYIAQHSLHHLEEYLQETPIQYIQERFRQGIDRDLSKLKTMALTELEQEEMKETGQVCEVLGRQMRGKQMWYEVRKTGRKKGDNHWFPLEELTNPKGLFRPYVAKLIKNCDMRQQALDSGMAIRPITSAEILAHLIDFGIDQQLAHGKIRQMSGGQRQRLVICTAFWSKPHLIALDEPTNYLDNDTLAALTLALKTFKGAVVTVSHKEAFVAEISNEKWVVQDGAITCVQLRDAKAR